MRPLVYAGKMLYDRANTKKEGNDLVKTILFDMDGVLVATERMHYEALNDVLAQAIGRTMDWEYYAMFVGSTNAFMWSTLEKDFALGGTSPALHEAYTRRKQQVLARDGYTPVEGAPELVRALAKQGHRMAVASSSPMCDIQAAMQELGIIDCFEALVSGETVEHPKPAPDVFYKAAACVHSAPADCVVIEDSANGVRAAKAAGMTCIGLRNPDSGNQDLSLADYIVDTLWDAKAYIEKVSSISETEPTK